MVQYKNPKKDILCWKYNPTYLQSPVDFIKVQPKKWREDPFSSAGSHMDIDKS